MKPTPEQIAAAKAEGMRLYALAGEPVGDFIGADGGGVVAFGDVDGIADVIAVAMGDEDVIAADIGGFHRR